MSRWDSLKTKKIIKTVCENPNETRLITVFRMYPLYQSSGINSHSAGTWFPFCGFLEFNFMSVLLKKGYFLKPSDNGEPMPGIRWLLEEPYNLDAVFLSRFGDVDGICISYVMGGGFWNTSRGREIGLALEEKLGGLIGYLKQQGLMPFEPCVEPPPELCITDQEDLILLNSWLCEKSGCVRAKMPEDDLAIGVVRKMAQENFSYRELWDESLRVRHSVICDSDVVVLFLRVHGDSSVWKNKSARETTIKHIADYANRANKAHFWRFDTGTATRSALKKIGVVNVKRGEITEASIRAGVKQWIQAHMPSENTFPSCC